jgi:hypothetical protein
MTFRETALANKGKQEMKLWAKVYGYYTCRVNDTAFSSMNADDSIERFNERFNDHGNVV